MFLYIDINLKNNVTKTDVKIKILKKKDKALLNTIINIYKTPVNYKKMGVKLATKVVN